jgi:predicted transcriptional regulator
MQRYSALLIFILGFAVITTSLEGTNVFAPQLMNGVNKVASSPVAGGTGAFSAEVTSAKVIQFMDQRSLPLASSSWLVLGALVVWRGRIRAAWSEIGLEEELFVLFVSARGAATRRRLLQSVSAKDKDRFQISRDLNLAWRAVDRHVKIMTTRGLLREKEAYGNVRLYGITPLGEVLLRTVIDMDTVSLRPPSALKASSALQSINS